MTGGGCERIPGVTGVVLAGGRSTRMGRDKAGLDLGGTTLAARQVGLLRSLFERVLVAASAPGAFAPLGVEVVPDRLGEGPLAGVAAALAAARTPLIFVCAVDMPFIEPALVRRICALVPGFDAAVPEGEAPGTLEPTLAVYGTACLAAFEARLARGELALHAALADIHFRRLAIEALADADPERASFRNINTPEDFRRATEARRPRGDGTAGPRYA